MPEAKFDPCCNGLYKSHSRMFIAMNRERPGSSAILTSRQNALQPNYIRRLQQAVLNEAGIALLEAHSIKEKHETYHVDHREQRVVLRHKLIPVLVCHQQPICKSTRGLAAVLVVRPTAPARRVVVPPGNSLS